MTASREPDVQAVLGERSIAQVSAKHSLQARMSSLLAAGLMGVLGLSALTWYYANTFTRGSHARTVVQATAANRAQGEMSLPPLGRILPPRAQSASVTPLSPVSAPEPAPPDMLLPETTVPPTPVAVGGGTVGATMDLGQTTVAAKTPGQLARERRLSGTVFAREAATASASLEGQPPSAFTAGKAPAADADRMGEPDGTLRALLRPATATAVQAQLLPTSRFLLPKGAFIDCTLETAIDSTLPGLTTCVTAADTFSVDGKVVLLERGSKLVGETRGQVQQGQARVFVVWNQARTPAGVVVPLDSPGTDELGRSGLPGQVERHFWQRFGAAMLISIVNGAVQAGVQAANHSGGAVIYAPSTSQDIVTEVLKDTIHIPPTIIKRNGDRIQVLVARDLDFRSVYELRTSANLR
jgi:type IV secretion system protein VirB10